MELLQSMGFTPEQWLWLVTVAFMVGFSKTGISGMTTLAVPIVAAVFGGKASTGIILPMLVVGDVFAVKYYNRHAEWGNIKKLIFWAAAGLALGIFVGNLVDDKQFKVLIALSVLVCLGILIYTERRGEQFKVPEKVWFYALTGIASGFTSMIGNAAGPILSVYLLAKGYKKNSFMGTYAWFFLIINLIKMPLQIFFWNNIPLNTLMAVAAMIPIIAFGAWLGIIVIKKLNEKLFRWMIIIMTALAAGKLIL